MSMSSTNTMILSLVFASILFLFSHSAVAQPTNFAVQSLSAPWSQRASGTSFVLPPESQINSAGAYVLGGRNNNYDALNDIWFSGDSGRTWENVGTTPVAVTNGVPALYVGSFGSSSEFVGVFGTSQQPTFTNDVWLATTSLSLWSRKTAAYAPRSDNAAAVLDFNGERYVFIMGGSDNTQLFNDVWFSSATNILAGTGPQGWLNVPNTPWTPRFGMAIASFHQNSRIIVAGGLSNAGYFNDVWILSVDFEFQPQWTSASSTTFPTRASGVLFNINEYLYFTSGRDSSTFYNDVYKSLDDGKTWTSIYTGNANFPARSQVLAFVFDNQVVIAAGAIPGSGGRLDFQNDVYAASLG